jgi:thiamine-phosphate pyrophosphorylase
MNTLPPLYLITDRHQVPDGRRQIEIIEELLSAGVRMLQLREKDLPAAELYLLAKELRALTRTYDCLLLINDRVDLVLATEADGVHLGGHSMPLPLARKLLGPDRLVGASTHSPEEIQIAGKQGADFATFGPVFFTPSKAAYGDPLGLDNLQQGCATSQIPVYGLGGINLENAGAVKLSGAHGIALISTLIAAEKPSSTCQKLLKILGN